MNRRGGEDQTGRPKAPGDVVPTAADSWRRHVHILETLEKIRETRRSRRAPDRPRPDR